MPELPDIVVYVEAIRQRVHGRHLHRSKVASPFVLRTFEPPIESVEGRKVVEVRRIGKRIAIGCEEDYWLVIHLMIAGRLHWIDRGETPRTRQTVVQMEFDNGTLFLTEAGSKHRASLHVIRGAADLTLQDPGGIDVLEAAREEFSQRLTRANHTLKRALTDPRLFSGIGNAYSDEILHRARLSPIALSQRLSAEERACTMPRTRP